MIYFPDMRNKKVPRKIGISWKLWILDVYVPTINQWLKTATLLWCKTVLLFNMGNSLHLILFMILRFWKGLNRLILWTCLIKVCHWNHHASFFAIHCTWIIFYIYFNFTSIAYYIKLFIKDTIDLFTFISGVEFFTRVCDILLFIFSAYFG